MGEKGAGRRISKRGGSREKWETFHNIGTLFRNRKSTRRLEPLQKGAGTGNVECRRREVQTPLSTSPPPHCTVGLIPLLSWDQYLFLLQHEARVHEVPEWLLENEPLNQSIAKSSGIPHSQSYSMGLFLNICKICQDFGLVLNVCFSS